MPVEIAKVLIVEDDPINSISMREVLTLIGLKVAGVAASVNDALCLAENTRPDLAFFDVRLAGRRDGIEGALILRERLGLPVVFVTSQIDAQTTARATEVEPVAYLTKPVGSRDLIEAVQKARASRSGSDTDEPLRLGRAWPRGRDATSPLARQRRRVSTCLHRPT
jgi:DNA-binding NarL/FixJ family response regulator